MRGILKGYWLFLAAFLVILLIGALYAKIDDPIVPIEPIEDPVFLISGTQVDSGFYEQEVLDLQTPQLPLMYAPERGDAYYVGIAVHIVRNDDGSGGPSDVYVENALEFLSTVYEPGGIIFFQLTDFEYINSTLFNTDKTSFPTLRSEHWVPNAINIYYSRAVGYGIGGESGSIGSNQTWAMINSLYAHYPSSVPHEIGHILYLYHTHQGYNECTDGSNCDVAGDLICDTPADPNLNSGVNANCEYIGNDTPPCGGLPYDPDTENIMSYAPTGCRDHLTAGQFERAEDFLYNWLSRIIYDIPHAFYVDATYGSDDNYGTFNYPYATITYAIAQADDGDTIFVNPGVYFEGLVIDKDIALISTEGPLVTTIRSNQYTNLVEFHDVEADIAVVDGFHLMNGKMGIWCENSDPLISHCLFDRQHGGIWAAVTLSGESAGELGISPARLINNTIFGCDNGAVINNSTVAPVIRNNIIYSNEYGIYQGSGAAAPDNDYNDVYYNPIYPYYPQIDSNYIGDLSVLSPGAHSISVEPMLTSQLRLYEYSPCENAGDPDPAYNDPDGSRNDMGAIPGTVEITPQGCLYVDDDGGVGVYTTISEAVAAAEDYYEIRVKPGTYTESINFGGKTLRLISEEGPEETFIIGGNWGWAFNFESGEKRWTEINGFSFGLTYTLNIIQIGSTASVKITDCIFPDIQRTTQYYNVNPIAIGAYHNGLVEITRNLFYNTTMQGCIRVFSGGDTVLIVNNTFDDCLGGVKSASNLTICKNNIITNCSDFGVYGTFGELDYNDVWNNTTNYAGGSAAGGNSISADPRFADAVNRDYRLTILSPCRDQGDPDPIYNDPDGSRNDMGAYPYTILEKELFPLFKSEGNTLPDKFSLDQNYPNPFNPSTEICFNLPYSTEVTLDVYNIMGQKVKTLIEGVLDAGYQSVSWDGTSSSGNPVASGIYFYRLKAAGFVETKKMSLVK